MTSEICGESAWGGDGEGAASIALHVCSSVQVDFRDLVVDSGTVSCGLWALEVVLLGGKRQGLRALHQQHSLRVE